MLVEDTQYYDIVGDVDIKNIADIPDDVHFRESYIRLEGTNDLLEDERFRSDLFTVTVQFAVVNSLDKSMTLIELPIGYVELRILTQD